MSLNKMHICLCWK